MEGTTGPKTPLQIRLSQPELAALDTYITQFTEFPPSRVEVARRALTEWLAQKLAPPHALQPSIVAPEPLPALPVPRAADGHAIPVPSPEDAQRERRRAQVVAALPWAQDNPVGISPADIRRTTGFSRVEVANDLRILGRLGEIRKVGAGHYVRRAPQHEATRPKGSM